RWPTRSARSNASWPSHETRARAPRRAARGVPRAGGHRARRRHVLPDRLRAVAEPRALFVARRRAVLRRSRQLRAAGLGRALLERARQYALLHARLGRARDRDRARFRAAPRAAFR